MLILLRMETDIKYMTMIEHVYNIKVWPSKLKDRVYIAGFADQNIVYLDGGVKMRWVSEYQLGIGLIDQFYLVAEYRINDLLPSGNYGLGYGFQYKVAFK